MRRLQSIEFAIRSAFQLALVRLLGGPRVVPVPDWRSRPYRILFIRDDGIGDLIVSMEVIRAIKESSQSITMDLLCSPQNAAFGRSLPFVSDVIVHKRGPLAKSWRAWRELGRRGYDAVIDGRVAIGNVNTQTTMLMLSTKARWRIGVAGRRNDRVYNVPVDPGKPAHWVDYIAALARPFGIQGGARDWRARLTISEAQRDEAERMWNSIGAGRPRILVNISVGNSERFWRHHRYAPVSGARPGASVGGDDPGDRDAGRTTDRRGPRASRRGQGRAALPRRSHGRRRDGGPRRHAGHRHHPRRVGFSDADARVDAQGHGAMGAISHPGKVVYGDIKRRLEPGLPEERVVRALDELIDEMAPNRGWI